jgi:hypothetical protein
MGKPRRFLVLLFFCGALPCFAIDFGLALNQSGEFTNNAGDGTQGNYTGIYSPWLSADFGDTAKLYLSAKISTVYENEAWKPKDVPILGELGRFDFSWRPLPSVFVDIGRIPIEDTTIAAGLFDGINSSITAGKVRVALGAFYTGLQYKESAKILMTQADVKQYIKPLDSADMDTYFASRRVVISAGVDFPDLSPRTTLFFNTLAQFDVNSISDDDDLLHSSTFRSALPCRPWKALCSRGAE